MKKLFLGLICFLCLQASLLAWEPEAMVIVFRRGEQLYEQGKYKEAIVEFEKVLDMSPDNKLAIEHKREAEEKIRSLASLEARREKERYTWQEQERVRERLNLQRQQRYRKQFEQEMKEALNLEVSAFKLTKESQEKLQELRLKTLAEVERNIDEQQRILLESVGAAESERIKKLERAQEMAFLRAEADNFTFPIKGFRQEKGAQK